MALPPNWTKYTTDEGKEYYHNSVTTTTTWEKPEWSGASPDSLSFGSQSSEVYRPTASDLDAAEGMSGAEGRMVPLSIDGPGHATAGQEAKGGKLPITEAETVSLRQAPSGAMGGSASSSAAGGMVGFGSMLASAAAGSEEGAAGVQGMAGWALSSAQALFDVSSDDVLKRLRLALMPFKAQDTESNDFRTRPDFWGPFWVATTAVLFLAATGNFARLLEMEDNSSFKADYSLVSVAATMIYGCLIGVPALARLGLYCSGHEVDSINIKQVICVYGYSLTSAIPASILCLVPVSLFRWLVVLLGLGVSLTFIRGTLWTDIAIEAPSLKWTVLGLFVSAQATIFLTYRLHFFNSVS